MERFYFDLIKNETSETSRILLKVLYEVHSMGVQVNPAFVIQQARNILHEQELHAKNQEESLTNSLRVHQQIGISPQGPPDPMYFLFPYELQAPCVFCKALDLPSMTSHACKKPNGDVVCPMLSKLTCKICNATGTKAHTVKYCPKNPVTKGDPNRAGYPSGRGGSEEAQTYKAVYQLFYERFNIALQERK